MEEQEYELELERARLLRLQLTPKRLTPHSFFNYGMEDLKTPAGKIHKQTILVVYLNFTFSDAPTLIS